jgi:1,4-dihydroxy-2-naphthoate octaprenyltransferase
MRIVMLVVALIAMMLGSACATGSGMLHAYPSFAALQGGRILTFERQTTGNLLPVAKAADVKRSTRAVTRIR